MPYGTFSVYAAINPKNLAGEEIVAEGRAPTAQEFRIMAETVRVISSMQCSDSCKVQLRQVAQEYERMAEELEKK